VLVALLAVVPVAPLRAQPAGSAEQPQPAGQAPGSSAGRDGERQGRFEPDLERIRRGLERPDVIDIRLPDGARPMFRVDVEGKLPDVWTWLGDPRELTRGGTPRVPSYHEEFLRLVTPEEVRAAYTNGELAQVLATAFAGQLALNALVNGVRGAVAGTRQRRACEEVRDSLRQLNDERARAGLPPVHVPEC
jgi:hypothetical protein